ncbi:hypothetical protein TL16_g09748 [Triparma laevis f. inornata]|uniref:Uncharacterized protein n=1 Tax=Triparma laevis f. inornata TaxID=1714386 RepID=A0A9W7BBS9_9STRA|nr:hypothetical protein TL16_g09748 [Triparma laevis f. inornata]
MVSILKTDIDVLLEKTPEWVWKEEQNINDKIVSEYVKYLMVVEENKDNVEGNVRRFKGGLEGFYGKVNPEQLKKIPSILERYSGRLNVLNIMMKKKYKNWKDVELTPLTPLPTSYDFYDSLVLKITPETIMKDLIGRKGVKRCIVDLRVKNEKGENADAKLPVAVGVEMGRLREGDMGVIRDLEVFKGEGEMCLVSSGYSSLKSLGVSYGKKGTERVSEDKKMEWEASMWFVKMGFEGVLENYDEDSEEWTQYYKSFKGTVADDRILRAQESVKGAVDNIKTSFLNITKREEKGEGTKNVEALGNSLKDSFASLSFGKKRVEKIIEPNTPPPNTNTNPTPHSTPTAYIPSKTENARSKLSGLFSSANGDEKSEVREKLKSIFGSRDGSEKIDVAAGSKPNTPIKVPRLSVNVPNFGSISGAMSENLKLMKSDLGSLKTPDFGAMPDFKSMRDMIGKKRGEEVEGGGGEKGGLDVEEMDFGESPSFGVGGGGDTRMDGFSIEDD